MPSKNNEELLRSAKNVLEKNWMSLAENEGFTRPSNDLYPFQWNWDSGFFACGYAHYDFKKAEAELSALFKGQWKNGFLPHIIFHGSNDDTKKYFPGPKIWDVQSVTDEAPSDVQTSGITQPPLAAIAVWHIYKVIRAKDKQKALDFLRKFYPKLLKLHSYFHKERDPENSGLITIFHPWESGLDNSPRWDAALEKIEPADMSQWERWDTKIVDPKERPSDEDYGRYMALLLKLKEHHYSDSEVYESFPFRIKDLLFSCIMYEADKRMLRIAERLNEDTTQIDHWMTQFQRGLFDKCWHEKCHCFYDYDLVKERQIEMNTVTSLMPMITGVLPQNLIREISSLLQETDFCGEQACALKLTPSMGLKNELFDSEKYWRGPIWININWFLWKGFAKCGMTERAEEIRKAILDLVAKEGFREYYSPLTGKGLGAKDFAWSAALTIDLLHDH